MIPRYEMRKAFSMITAIFIILLMASVAAFVMSLTGKVTQETVTQYRKEQAILLAKSYTELAIMTATAQNCAPYKITANVGGNTAAKTRQGEGYSIEVHTRYIGNNSGCNSPRSRRIGGAVENNASIGSTILIDTYVRYRNPDELNAIKNKTFTNSRPGITYHRRTLQRL